MSELSTFCEKEIVRRFEQLDEIAIVDMHGFTLPQVLITPNVNILQVLQIDQSEVASQIANQNAELGNVVLKDGVYEYNVNLTSSLTTLDKVKNLPLRLGNQTYLLHQIASVTMAARTRRGSYLYNDQQAIALSIRKQSDANNFKLKEKVDTLLHNFAQDYPKLEFHLVQDQSKILKVSFDNLFSSLLYGLFFSSLIMFWFLGNWRTSLIILMVVPISLIISLFFFYLLDISINMISISGLILGVGLMIDNAIITIENIRQWLTEHDLSEASVEGPNEILAPMTSSALTTISVFMPLVLLGGIAGSLFYDQALSIAISLSCSVMVSFLIIPVLFYNIMKLKATKPKNNNNKTLLYRIHHYVLNFSITNRFTIVLIFLILSGISFYFSMKIPSESFPKTTVETLEIDIDWSAQIGIDQSEDRISRLYHHLRKDIVNVSSHIGEYQYLLSDQDQSINECLIKVNIMPNAEKTIEQKVNSYLKSNYADASFTIRPAKTVFDYIINTDAYPFAMYVSERSQLESPAVKTISDFIDTLGTRGITTFSPSTQSYFSLKIDREKAAIYQVSDQKIIQSLQSLFGNLYVTDLRASEQYIPIYLSLKNGDVSKEKINDITVTNSENKTLPLSNFISWQVVENYKSITSDRVGEMIELGVNAHTPDLPLIVNKLRAIFKNLEIRTGGQHVENEMMIAELKFIFLVVIGLLYLILAAQFESLVLPFIVLVSVPVSISCALLCLYITDQSINLISMVGLIIMSGIVVNDAILKVDMMKKGIKSGLDLKVAIFNAGDKRVSAIIMTSLTTILALTPLFFSNGLGVEIQKPMAIVVISGVTIGTFVSLSFTPALFSYYYKYFVKK